MQKETLGGGELNECSLGGQKHVTGTHAFVRIYPTAVNIYAFHDKFYLKKKKSS